jgi:hypothetical protein
MAALLVVSAPAFAGGDEGGWSYDDHFRFELPESNFELDIFNRTQFRLTAVDPDLGEGGESFDLKRYRLLFDAKAFKYWEFRLQTDFATGSLRDDEDEADLLLDAFIVFNRKSIAQLWFGQGKVDFGRQQLVDFFHQQFVERSIASERFVHGRDVGVALKGRNQKGTYEYSVGVYNGNGINETTDENDDYLTAARMAIMPLGPMESPLWMTESDPDWTTNPEAKLAVAVAVTSQNQGAIENERVQTAALEFAFRVRGLSINAEFFTESEDILTGPPADETDTDGWYAQAGYIFPISEMFRFEVALRYSEILRDTIDSDDTEAGVAFAWYFRGQNQKLQLDLRDLEFEGIQATPRIDRQEGRLQFQLIF